MTCPSGKKIGIVQSNYIPWKGYFDLIRSVDLFILYDDVQYTKNDWRNRNRIKTPQGLQWLTIPVRTSGRSGAKINEIQAVSSYWRGKHWRSIEQNYGSAPFFNHYGDTFHHLYHDSIELSLSRINRRFIDTICKFLGVCTPVRYSSEFDLPDGRVERLVELCVQTGCSHYVSGPAAKEYIEKEKHKFTDQDIAVTYMDYSRYPVYPQLYPPFEHQVTVLDLLFNTGPDALHFLGKTKKRNNPAEADSSIAAKTTEYP